jgi:complex iron-sulfur molybdoenzyme family reductase subunit gamma
MAAWSDRPYGTLAAVQVGCVHDGRRVAFRLEWTDPSEDLAVGDAVPDAAAIALPVRGEPQLATMGAPEAPIHALHWIAGQAGVRSVLATGIGSSRPGPDVQGAARGHWKDGAWRAVISRSFDAPADAAPLAPGGVSRIGFAIWDGAKGERAGIKAFSIDWLDLELEA